MHCAIELSNQCKSKKIGNGAETKEKELAMLQRQRNKGVKVCESRGRGTVPGTYAQTASERQATSQ